MATDRRVRRLAADGTVWHWTVRRRVRRDYTACRVTLTLFTQTRRLTLVFAPGPGRIVSNSHFEAGTVVRMPDRAELNLYEPGTVRRLLDAVLGARPSGPRVRVDGWSYFDQILR